MIDQYNGSNVNLKAGITGFFTGTTVSSYPATVGYLIPVKGFRIGLQEMPSKFHMFMMEKCFGWKFEKIQEQPQLLKG